MASFPSPVAGSLRRRATWALVAGILLALAGCGPSGPKTYPVQGKVVTTKADDLKLLAGQAVEFQSTTEPETRGFGQIQADGSFTISTYRQGVSLPGAVEGTHKVRLMIDLGGDGEDARPRKTKWPFDRKYTQFESSGWTITVPTEGEVVLRLP
jgi:predicted small lipoprotein YifL